MATPTAEHMNKLPPIVEAPAEEWEEAPSYPMDYKPPEEATADETPDAPASADADEPVAPAEGEEAPLAPADAPEAQEAGEDTPPADDIATKAKAWEDLQQSFARNPIGFMAQLREVMTPSQQQEFDRQFAPPPQAPEPEWDQSFREDEELTPEELYVKKVAAPALTRANQFQSEVTGWTQQAAQVFNNQAEAITQLSQTLESLKAELAAVKGEQAKAAVRVPKTPRNGAGSESQGMKIGPDDDMITIFNKLKSRGGRP